MGTWSPGGAPETGQASAAQIRQFTADNAAALRVGAAAALVGSVLMVFFIAGLAQLVRRSRRGTLIPTMLVVCGSAAIIGTLYLAASASVFGFPHELEGVSDATVVAFYDAAAVAEWFMAFIHLIVIFGWWLWPLAVGCALGWRWLRIRRG